MTSMYNSWLLIIFLPLVIAGVLDPRDVCKTYDDNYDNIAAPPTAGAAITNYNGLLYQGWNVINHASPLTAVQAHTQPNVIFASAATDLTTVGSVTMYPFGNILRGSGTKAFSLYSFYIGCSQGTAESAADIAVGCTIAVTGYDIYGKQVPVATYAYAPSASVNAPPNLATLPATFYLLQNVTFGIAQGGAVGGAMGTVLVVDDVVHCNFS